MRAWQIARQRVKTLARRETYRRHGMRPVYIGWRWKQRMAEIKAWEMKFRAIRTAIEQEDYVLNP